MGRFTVVAAAMLVVLAGCGDDSFEADQTAGPQRYQDPSGLFTMEYPGEWEEIPGLSSETQVGSTERVAAVAVGLLDTRSGNLIGASVEIQDIGSVIGDADQRAFLEEIVDPLMEQLAAAAGGSAAEPEWTSVAGREARRYLIDSVVRGQDLRSETTAFADADRFFRVTCQAPADRFEDEAAAGCAAVLDTFALGG